MNAILCEIMLRAESVSPASAAVSHIPHVLDETEHSYFKCMPLVSDYDEEWMTFVEQHARENGWVASGEVAADSSPRVWNLPHA